jgi:tRNA threonylcarbamoyladenosine biosynthesis protein TsaB
MSAPRRALAMDTATDVLAVAAVNGEARVSLTLRRGLQHSPALVPLVERLLSEISLAADELEFVACSVGPGSFTGIRIGLATAKGIGFAAGIPVIGVSTLDALAHPFRQREGDTFAVLDARKGNIYAARYRAGVRASDYLDLSPRDLAAAVDAADRPLLVGPDAEKLSFLMYPAGDEPAVPPPCSALFDPSAILDIALGVDPAAADPSGPHPLYLRRSEAEIEKERKG